jgi:hypothetical protein
MPGRTRDQQTRQKGLNLGRLHLGRVSTSSGASACTVKSTLPATSLQCTMSLHPLALYTQPGLIHYICPANCLSPINTESHLPCSLNEQDPNQSNKVRSTFFTMRDCGWLCCLIFLPIHTTLLLLLIAELTMPYVRISLFFCQAVLWSLFDAQRH